MPPAQQPDASAGSGDLSRTSLAAERTWLAWWRTGLVVASVAIAVGRLLPGLAKTPPWPFRLLGLGYAALGIAVLVIGGLRLQRTTSALQRGSYEPLSSPLVMWLTAAGVALATGTLILVAVAL